MNCAHTNDKSTKLKFHGGGFNVSTTKLYSSTLTVVSSWKILISVISVIMLLWWKIFHNYTFILVIILMFSLISSWWSWIKIILKCASKKLPIFLPSQTQSEASSTRFNLSNLALSCCVPYLPSKTSIFSLHLNASMRLQEIFRSKAHYLKLHSQKCIFPISSE